MSNADKQYAYKVKKIAELISKREQDKPVAITQIWGRTKPSKTREDCISVKCIT